MSIDAGVGPEEGEVRATEGRSTSGFAPPTGTPAPMPPPLVAASRGSHRVRNRWIVAGVGAALLAVAVVVVGTVLDDGPERAADWDPRVTDLVEFVQNERGLLFDHAVPVDFLTPEEYSETVGSENELTEEDLEDLEQSEGELRALGLVSGDVDLVESFGTLQDEGTLAFYDPHEERVTVRGTELTPALQVTLVHELTHALQDQHFDLKRLDDSDSSDLDSGFRALVEGDATRIENRYIDSLDGDARESYEDELDAQSDEADDQLADVPSVLLSYFGAPYVLGTDLVDLLEQTGGDKSINDAFDFPPDSEAALLDPFRFLDHEVAADVEVPALEDGEEHVDEGDLGAIAIFLMLTEKVDPHAALAAIDAWDGDAYVGFERDGRACVRAAVRTTDTLGAGALEDLLREWSDEVPEADATVRKDDTAVTFDACDPGTDAQGAGNGLGDSALALPVIRTEIGIELVRQGAPPEVARCVAGEIVGQFSTDELIAGDPAQFQTPAFFEQVAGFVERCGGG